MSEVKNRQLKAKKVTLIGMFINFLLLISKLIFGIIGNSTALVADGLHSLSDFISDIIVIIGFRFTSKPADKKHNYGHGKIETVSTVLIGLLLIFISLTLFKSSITTIYNFYVNNTEINVPKSFVLYVVIASIALKEFLFHLTFKVGKKIKSNVLIANAWHHRSDSLSSIAAFIGIFLAILLGEKYAVSDPIASLVVSILIFKVGLDIIIDSLNQLIDVSLSDEEIKKIEDSINDIKAIKGYCNIKTRRIGYYVSIDIVILVDKNLNVEKAHNIANQLELNFYKIFGSESIINIHVEPFTENNASINGNF